MTEFIQRPATGMDIVPIAADTEDWKTISTINHPLALRYQLNKVKNCYMVSRDGQILQLEWRNGKQTGPITQNDAISSSSVKLAQPYHGKILKTSINESRYENVCLGLSITYKKPRRTFFVHVLVGCAFVKYDTTEDISKLTIDHIDSRVRNNNHYTNLRWATKSVQVANRSPHGIKKLWIQGCSAFFTEDDFKVRGDPTKSFELRTFKNRTERIAIENEIKIPDEEWREITVKDKIIRVSSHGRCYYNTDKKVTWGHHRDDNYASFGDCQVNRLVAKAFLQEQLSAAILKYGLSEEQLVVNHKDHNKCNNHYLNLEWITRAENTAQSFAYENPTRLTGRGNIKPVYEIDMDYKILETYLSMTDAATLIKKSIGEISRICKRNETGPVTAEPILITESAYKKLKFDVQNVDKSKDEILPIPYRVKIIWPD
jgi:hypothetical protein